MYNRIHLPEGIETWFEYFLSDYSQEIIEKYKNTKKIVISDCDGILNDGHMHHVAEGKFMKSYGCHDKELVKFLSSLGWKFLFISNDQIGGQITKQRLIDSFGKFIDISKSFMLGNDSFRKNMVDKYNKDGYITLFCGDSISDIASLNIATYAGTTNNAFYLVKPYCDYVSKYDGGNGGFADILYFILIQTLNDIKNL